jgi:hypothetical protein
MLHANNHDNTRQDKNSGAFLRKKDCERLSFELFPGYFAERFLLSQSIPSIVLLFHLQGQNLNLRDFQQEQNGILHRYGRYRLVNGALSAFIRRAVSP